MSRLRTLLAARDRVGESACSASRADPSPWPGFEHRCFDVDGLAPDPSGLSVLAAAPVARALYLDLETTGLPEGAAMPFVVGLVEHGTATARAHLFVLWAPREEVAMLEAVAGVLGRCRGSGTWIVTYNGTRFDLPVLSARYRILGLEDPFAGEGLGHLDVLPHARRLLAWDLPRRNLQAVERRLLGTCRRGDVAGREIPAIYAAYLARGGPRQRAAVERVVEHNLWDLLGLAAVAERLAGIDVAPRTLGQAVGAARRRVQDGDAEGAVSVLEPLLERAGADAARRAPALAAEAVQVLATAALRCGPAGRRTAVRWWRWGQKAVPFDDRPLRGLRRLGELSPEEGGAMRRL